MKTIFLALTTLALSGCYLSANILEEQSLTSIEIADVSVLEGTGAGNTTLVFTLQSGWASKADSV